jgi:hypothetical protein
MSDFINTVDVIGDDALTCSIIDKSIVEIRDNCVEKVGISAFYSCPYLTIADFPLATEIDTSAFERSAVLAKVNFPSVTRINNNAFKRCSELTTAYFSALTYLSSMVFDGCSKLNVLVLRYEVMATLSISSALSGTKIANGTGYIYVPRALLSDDDATKDYRRATNWSTYATQFRALEDYTVDGTITGELDPTKI